MQLQSSFHFSKLSKKNKLTLCETVKDTIGQEFLSCLRKNACQTKNHVFVLKVI